MNEVLLVRKLLTLVVVKEKNISRLLEVEPRTSTEEDRLSEVGVQQAAVGLQVSRVTLNCPYSTGEKTEGSGV
jgi:hypothetical protein